MRKKIIAVISAVVVTAAGICIPVSDNLKNTPVKVISFHTLQGKQVVRYMLRQKNMLRFPKKRMYPISIPDASIDRERYRLTPDHHIRTYSWKRSSSRRGCFIIKTAADDQASVIPNPARGFRKRKLDF